ncbi:MAG: Integral rane protein [Candidatus Eremiobacteraeota bacterium]|nr:Integral rane protein [Candidatus Eremiobacteraeota bacterium]
MSRPVQNVVFVLLTGLGWGLLGPASKALYAIDGSVWNGLTVAVARSAFALPIFLFALAIAWRVNPPRLDAKRWLAVVAAGLIFGLVISVVFTMAAQYTSVAHISFLIGVSPVTNTAVAALVFRTALDRRQWIALSLGIVGVAVLAATHSSDKSAFLGDVLMVVWLAAFAAYACLIRVVGARLNAGMTMALIGTISMASLFVAGVLLGHGAAIAHVADTPSTAWWFFGEIVFGSTLIAQTTYTAAVRRLGVSVATIGAEYTALAVGVAMSLALHEPWTPLTVVGGLVLCCALAATFVPIPWLRTSEAPTTAA